MGMLSNIFHKIFPSSHPAVAQADTAAAPESAASAGPSASAGTSPPPSSSAPAAASMPEVDVEQVLNNMSQASGQTLNWRTSIVDLLKLLGLDSSLQARKELASELGYS